MNAESAAGGAAMTRRRRPVRDLSSLLDVIESKVDEDGERTTITVREVLEVIGRRAYGPLLLLIGLIAISPLTLIPGSTWAFAALTLALALQLALHKRTPWMPPKVLAMRLPEEPLAKFIERARPTARFLDRFVRPRLEFFADAPWVIGVALLIALAALITFPLGLIPLAPLAPGLAIVLFGLGLTARDGLLLALGGAIMGTAVWIVFTRVF
jgi:hypothetical protein